VLQFLGDVNLFHGRMGHTAEPGSADDVSYVRPHELEIVADTEAGADTWPVTLAHTLTVGPNTRLEFQRTDGPGQVDVELPRAQFVALRERLRLEPGARVQLRPRRITRFAAAALAAAATVGGGAAQAAAPSDLEAAGVAPLVAPAIDQRLLNHWAG
jgi:sulfate transport system ATP-binding protein